MNIMKNILINLLIILSTISLFAQNDMQKSISDSTTTNPAIKVIGASFGDSIIIRWAPTDVDAWIMGFNRGFNIYRITLNDSLMAVSKRWKKLNDELIFPYSIPKFKELFAKDSSDNYALIAAESLYGKYGASGKTEIKPKSMGEIILESEDFKDRLAMCLLASDFSALAAKSMGWRWVDYDISKDSNYMYRVSSPYIDTLPVQLESGLVTVETKKQYRVRPFIAKVDELEKQVNLLLPRKYHEKYFTGFWFEKSTDNGKTYKRLNKLPFLNPLTDQKGIGNKDYIVYTDTFPENYIPALYRVIGLTPFATITKPSKPVKAMGKDKTPPALPDTIITETLQNNKIKISWEYSKVSEDLKGFYIARSDKPKTGFRLLQQEILPKDTRSYIDKNPEVSKSNYYTLICVDTAGNGSRSLSVLGYFIDSIPPEKPTNLTGSIDTNGVVTITWDKGKEPDLYGYFVYMANNKDHIFSNMTGRTIPDTVFKDTISLQTLTEEIYYKIKAVDINYNESDFSDLLLLKKPDFIAPTSPLLTGAKVFEDSIVLSYRKSHSTDLAYYYLLRKNNSANWDTINIFKWDSIPEVLSDTDLKPNTKYTYALVAIDDAGNSSAIAYALTAKTKQVLPKGKILQFDIAKKDKTIEISWQYQGNKDDRIFIYRALETGKFKLIKNVETGKLKYSDKHIKPYTKYRYRLIAETKRGYQLDYTEAKEIVE